MAAASRVPCRVGDSVGDIDTPALVLQLDKLEKNVRTMAESMSKFPNVALRPHAKAHKCPAIARLQVESGAVGMCCQKLTEAVAMVEGGIKDVFVCNEVIGTSKLRRLISLSKRAELSLCVDSVGNLHDINDVAQEFGEVIDLVIDVNVGQDRCGIEPGEPVAELASEIVKLSSVNFKGIHCYHGTNQHVRTIEGRRQNVQMVVDKVQKTLSALKLRGLECNYITGGGTGSFKYESATNLFTEVQPGSYVLMDVDYSKNLDEDGKFAQDFEHSLFVLSTVQSVAAGNRAVVDAGMKALSMDSGVPVVSEHSELIYHNGGDEHGILKPSGNLQVGDLLFLIPGHCDPTMNLYDWVVGLRNGRVEAIWPITARGPGI